MSPPRARGSVTSHPSRLFFVLPKPPFLQIADLWYLVAGGKLKATRTTGHPLLPYHRAKPLASFVRAGHSGPGAAMPVLRLLPALALLFTVLLVVQAPAADPKPALSAEDKKLLDGLLKDI